MSAILAAADGRLTVEQYLDWAERQPAGRYELVGGVPIKMSPERNRHLVVKGAVYRAFLEAVRATAPDHDVLPDGGTVVISRHQSREPDLSVVRRSSLDLDRMTVDQPIVLVEVTSPSTIRTDTEDKLIEYFSLPSVHHYLLVHPVHQTVVHHRRMAGRPIETSILPEGMLRFDPPGFSVAIERFFEDLQPGRGQ